MKLIFNFNNYRFVVESHLKRVDGKAKQDGVIVNVYDIDMTCNDKTATFEFSDLSLDGKSPKELNEERLIRALMFMAQDVADFVSVDKDDNKLVELNEWEKLDRKTQKACINEVKEYYKIYDYFIHDDSLAEHYENMVGSMWMSEVGYEIAD